MYSRRIRSVEAGEIDPAEPARHCAPAVLAITARVASLPALVVVSGPAGAGKTTLAHEIGRAVGCPVICRDEIKEGMVQATPGFVAGPGDELSRRTLPVFFDVLELLLRAGVTTVAEAAFQASQRVTACLTSVRPKSHMRPLPRCASSMTSVNASQNSFTSVSVMFSGGSSLITSV